MSEFSLVKASAEDLAYLLQLRLLTMVAHLESSGLFYSEAEQQARVMHEFDLAHLIYWGEDLIGMLKFEVGESELKIWQLQIHPDFQNQGLGRRIMMQLFATYPEHQFGLSVLKSNPAKALYQRLGFEIYDEDEFEFFMTRAAYKN